MKHFNIFAVVIFLALVGCTHNKKKNNQAKTDETVMEGQSEVDELLEEDVELEGFAEGDEILTQEGKMANNNAPVEMSGDMGSYTVEKGDTLLLVAFKVYGDYAKWRDIQQMNPNVNPSNLIEGTVLNYTKPMQPFVWKPTGEPHLIKEGETLGIISQEKYGTPMKWKSIFDNNRPMIKNPNLIFAGFTLYYLPEDRNVASDQI